MYIISGVGSLLPFIIVGLLSVPFWFRRVREKAKAWLLRNKAVSGTPQDKSS